MPSEPDKIKLTKRSYLKSQNSRTWGLARRPIPARLGSNLSPQHLQNPLPHFPRLWPPLVPQNNKSENSQRKITRTPQILPSLKEYMKCIT